MGVFLLKHSYTCLALLRIPSKSKIKMCWLVTPYHTPCFHTSNLRIYTPCKALSETVPVVGKAGPYTQHIRPHYPPKLNAGCKFNKLIGQQDFDELCSACLKKELYQKELREKEALELPGRGGMTWRTGNGVRHWSDIAGNRVDFGIPEERKALREEMLKLAENSDPDPPVYGSRLVTNADVVALRQEWNEQSSSGKNPVWKSSREERRKDRADAEARKRLERLPEETNHQSSTTDADPIRGPAGKSQRKQKQQ